MDKKREKRVSFVEKPEELYCVETVDELKRIIEQCRGKHKTLANLNLSKLELKNIDMSCLVIKNVVFNVFDVEKPAYKSVYNVSFKGSRLNKVSFAQCKLVRCNFDKWEPVLKEEGKLLSVVDLNKVQDQKTCMEEVDFFLCQFELCRFRRTNIRIADFRYSQFSDCSMGGSRIELGDFYMAAFRGTTNFTDCMWTYCSITNATFENHCLRMKELGRLAQECYEEYSGYIIGYDTWHKQNPCADFSHQNEAEDKGRILGSKSYICREASEVYALLSGFYAGKGLFRDSNIAYERAKRNEALSQYYVLKEEVMNGVNRLLGRDSGTGKGEVKSGTEVYRIGKSMVSLLSFIPCWVFGFGYKLMNVLICFVVLVLVFGYVFHVKNNEREEWYDELGYSLNNSMGPLSEFMDVVGCWLSSLQTTIGLLLVGFAGFIIANRIRNNY